MTGLGAAGCDTSPMSADDGGRKDVGAEIKPDAIGGGGICPVQIGADAAVSSPDSFLGGGICAPMMTFDANVSDAQPIYLGGVCPVAAPDVTGSDAPTLLPFGPGIC